MAPFLSTTLECVALEKALMVMAKIKKKKKRKEKEVLVTVYKIQNVGCFSGNYHLMR